MIEKHFALSREIKTPNSFFSIEPQKLKNLVENIRIAEKALGKVYYGATEQEKKEQIFKRSLFVIKDVNAGEVFTEENIRSIRPGHGLHPKHIKTILGKKAKKDLKEGIPLDWDIVQ